jgi:hypothetical protein
MKSLTYHLRAQRYYTDLLYKARETNRTTYWANTHKRWKVFSEGKFSQKIIQAMFYAVIWFFFRDVQS